MARFFSSSFIFTVTIFISAYLLFLIQPMVGKVLLPIMGGTPSVWNTAMVFFQILLLGGYLYAHLLTKIPSVKIQIGIHAGLLMSAFVLLPMGVSYAPPAPDDSPFWWQIQTMMGMIGLPFFILSTSAPLLQRWFSLSNHPNAQNPYFLYAASNIGSVLALILYPTVTERFLSLINQTQLFQFAFFVLALCLLTCGGLVRKARIVPLPTNHQSIHDDKPTIKQMVIWLLLAFVPSSLMLGYTTFVTTDIGSTPLFWIIPLTLYILSFVIAFSRQTIITLDRTKVVFIVLFLSVYVLGGIFMHVYRWEVAIGHGLLMFVTAIMCHKNLDVLKPSPRYLTLFFLIMSLGGALGGLFNALLAPLVFVRPYEYMVTAALSILCWGYQNKERYLVPVALIILIAFPTTKWDFSNIKLVHQSRNYFGYLSVIEYGDYRVANHGTTIHGAQSLDESQKLIPLTYYHKDAALSKALDVVKDNKKTIHAATLGLGVGAFLCRLREQDTMQFYEIDPDMIKLASDPQYFTYLSGCKAKHSIVLGDARIKIKETPDATYDYILADAFSSDNIPVHLLTREAVELYLKKIKPDGMVVFHISNRFLALHPELALIAKALNTTALYRTIIPEESEGNQDTISISPTKAVVITSNPTYIKSLEKDGWVVLDATNDNRNPWTDDFVNPLRALIYKVDLTSSP